SLTFTLNCSPALGNSGSLVSVRNISSDTGASVEKSVRYPLINTCPNFPVAPGPLTSTVISTPFGTTTPVLSPILVPPLPLLSSDTVLSKTRALLLSPGGSGQVRNKRSVTLVLGTPPP